MNATSSGFGFPLGGLRKSLGRLASQNRLLFALPSALQSSTWRGSQVSRFTDRTCSEGGRSGSFAWRGAAEKEVLALGSAHLADVHAQRAVHSTAAQADEAA